MSELHDFINQRGARHKEVERSKPVVQMATRLADAQDALRSSARTVANNANLSPDGQRLENRKYISDVTVKYLHNAKSLSASRREDLAGWQARLVPAPVEKTDAASAVLHAQIRDRVNAMPAAKQIAFLGRSDLPRDVFSALLHGPEFLSGLDASARAALLQNYRAIYHADDVAQIAQAKEALDLLDAVSATVANEAGRVGGFAPHEFSAILEK